MSNKYVIDVGAYAGKHDKEKLEQALKMIEEGKL